MTTVLSIENVSKTMGKKKIIDDISLTIQEGEVFGLLGPNGAGKTTTIRMIVGLMKMTSGDIVICGNSIRKDFEQAIKHVGAIVENPEMYQHLTGYQNLVQYGRMHKQVSKAKLKETIELVRLGDRINDKVKTYSLGMKQRLGLAQALLHEPKLLILDEPTNGLDPAGIREMRDHLRFLAKEKQLSIVVSSHLLSEMEMMCDRVAIIQQGKLIDVHDIHEDTTYDQPAYSFETGSLDSAWVWLEEKWKVERNEEGFIVHATKEKIAKLVKELSNSDIDIYGIKKITRTLEDRFLEITKQQGGKENVSTNSK